MSKKLSEQELRKIAAEYFGTGPSINPDSMDIEIIEPRDGGEKIKIRWEEHIGALSGVARVSDRDVLRYLKLPCTAQNRKQAVETMKGTAYRESLTLIKIAGQEKYLLINPAYRR